MVACHQSMIINSSSIIPISYECFIFSFISSLKLSNINHICHSRFLNMISYPCPILYDTLLSFADLNECLLILMKPLCSKFAKCANKPGSFECTCQNGYSGNGYYCEGTLFVCVYYARSNDGENYILL